jgi:hypothetical protein
MRAFGLQDYCHQIENFDPSALAGQIQSLEQERYNLVPAIVRTAAAYRQQVDETCRAVFCQRI